MLTYIWGPYKTKSNSGYSQFITIVYDFTRFTWVHLLKYKPEVPSILANFIQYVETQFNTKVICIRSDNAKELCEGASK